MSTYTIGEAAERTGFTPSALRYYEGIGLVAPAGRTGAGYRLYDDDGVATLAFVGRAKQLGCSLDEITDLLAVRDGERCEPVQRQFHELVTSKLGDARRRIAELTELTEQLRSAAERLAGPAVDGPCDEGCACATAAAAGPGPVPVQLLDRPPIACTLSADAVPDRMDEWRAALAGVRRRTVLPDGGLRLELDDSRDVGELARLVAAEQQCCAFFSFAITADPRGVALEVRAPAEAAELVFSLFGAAS